MAKFLILVLCFAFVVEPGLNRKLWEPSVTEIEAPPGDNVTLNMDKDHPKVQISGLKGTLHFGIFKQLHGVHELRLIRNQVRHIESGALCPSRNVKVLELDFTGNENPPILTKNMFGGCNLEELFLKFDYNNPSTIEDNALEELQSLKVLGIDSLRLKHLETDFLKLGNNLTSLTLSNIHVEIIDANAFEQLTNLQEIEIVHNLGLEHIPEGLFRKCEKLKILNLKDNALKNLSWKEFEGLSSLEELHLADNRIENFDAGKIAKYMTKLNQLSIQMNAISCNGEKQFVTSLKSKFAKSITVSTNNDFHLCD